MYEFNLTESYFPAQHDAEIRDLTVGSLLRETAANHVQVVAMVDVDDSIFVFVIQDSDFITAYISCFFD